MTNCDQCGKKIEDKAVQLIDADWYHLKCAVKLLKYHCKSCDYYWSDNDDPDSGCNECGGKLEFIRNKKAQAKEMEEWLENPNE